MGCENVYEGENEYYVNTRNTARNTQRSIPNKVFWAKKPSAVLAWFIVEKKWNFGNEQSNIPWVKVTAQFETSRNISQMRTRWAACCELRLIHKATAISYDYSVNIF